MAKMAVFFSAISRRNFFLHVFWPPLRDIKLMNFAFFAIFLVGFDCKSRFETPFLAIFGDFSKNFFTVVKNHFFSFFFIFDIFEIFFHFFHFWNFWNFFSFFSFFAFFAFFHFFQFFQKNEKSEFFCGKNFHFFSNFILRNFLNFLQIWGLFLQSIPTKKFPVYPYQNLGGVLGSTFFGV